ncbi:MAG: polysaccharide biosynthesis C-terminal domain-containing protein [Candidatus Eisenbacteria bacterium]
MAASETPTTESHARGLLKSSAATMGTRLAIIFVNIPTSILIARLLGPEGQGTYTSAVVFPTLFAFIGLLGIDASHTFLLSKRQYTTAQVNGQSLRLAVILSVIAAPLYLLFVRLYPGAGTPGLRSILYLAALLIPVLMAKYLAVGLLLGLQRIRWFNLGNLIQAVALLGLMCLNLFVVRGGAEGALVAYLLSELAMTVVALRTARRVTAPGPLVEKPPPGMFRRSAVYGLQGHVGNILVQFLYRFDMFFVLSFAGVGAQGLYSIAVILAEKLSHIPQSVQVVLFPKLSSLESEDANELTPRVMRNAFGLTVVAALALLLLSRPLLLLFYGDAYMGALRAFRILIPGVVMLSFNTVLSGDLSARDKRVHQTVANAIGFGLNIVLCVVLIPRMGFEGAAWASTAAYSTQSVFMLAFFRRFSGRGVMETVFLRGDDFRAYGELLKRLLRR